MCRDAYDMLTCRGGGQCVETYSPVRTCFPNEWPPDRRVSNSSSRLTIDQDMYGSGARVTSYATREGMVDSDLIFEQFFLTTPKPVLYVISDDKNGSQYVQREIEKFQLRGVDPQANSDVRKLFLARPENMFWPYPKNRTLAVPKLSHGQDEGPYPAPLLIYFNFTLGALGGGELRDSIIYYTLNGSHPIPGDNYTFSVPPGQYVVVNSTVNISWVGVTRNLDPSDRQTHSIALQASQPELIALARYINKASGVEKFFFYDWQPFIFSVSPQVCAAICVCIRVRMLLYMCPHNDKGAGAVYPHVCWYVCPHTCLHTTIHVSSYYICPHTNEGGPTIRGYRS